MLSSPASCAQMNCAQLNQELALVEKAQQESEASSKGISFSNVMAGIAIGLGSYVSAKGQGKLSDAEIKSSSASMAGQANSFNTTDANDKKQATNDAESFTSRLGVLRQVKRLRSC